MGKAKSENTKQFITDGQGEIEKRKTITGLGLRPSYKAFN